MHILAHVHTCFAKSFYILYITELDDTVQYCFVSSNEYCHDFIKILKTFITLCVNIFITIA